MNNVVLYDPVTGEIIYSCQLDVRSIAIERERLGLASLTVEHFSSEYSVTHMVVDGQLVEKLHAI